MYSRVMLPPIICSPSILKAFVTACISAVLFFFGHEQNALIIAYVLICLDTISGFMAALTQGVISSRRFQKFFLKLFVATTAFVLGQMLENFEQGLSLVSYLLSAAIILNESISIIENLHRLDQGLLPKRLVVLLEKYLEARLEVKPKKYGTME